MSEELTSGTLIGGKFRITEKLGEGGMGSVYAGIHTDLGQRVAIKVILSGEINEEMLKRFRREALVLAQLESEHAVRVFDYGTLPDGSPYLVMEFLKGLDLQAYVNTRGPITVEEAAEIGMSVCDALGDAHSKGIVHRDLKPSNLFLADRPNGRRFVKVLDFGLSLFRPEGQELITKTHAVLGTPLYAAPEQFNASRDADGRADIWSLGASLYELVTGRVPFPAASLAELATKLREGAPPASAINPKVPAAFSDVLARCLKRKLQERTATVAELRRELKAFRALGKSSALFGDAMTSAERAAFAVTDEVDVGTATTEETVALARTEHTPALDVDDKQRTPKMVRRATQGAASPPRGYAIAGAAAFAMLAIVAVGVLALRSKERVTKDPGLALKVESSVPLESSVPMLTSAGLGNVLPPSISAVPTIALSAPPQSTPAALKSAPSTRSTTPPATAKQKPPMPPLAATKSPELWGPDQRK